MLKQLGVWKVHEMESTSINLKWLCFSGLSDEYPVWSTRFQGFSQTKGFFETLMSDYVPPNPPGRLPDGVSDEQHAAQDAATEAYMKAVIDIQKRNNTIWCYLAKVLDSTTLMLIRHHLDNKGLGDGREAWVLLQQKFQSDETVTVVNVVWQQSRLHLKEDDALHNYFIRAQELSRMLEHAGEHLSEAVLNAMVLNGLPECYEHFVVQENFNPAGSVVELRTRLMNYEESRIRREFVDDVYLHVAMTSKKPNPEHKFSSKYKAPPKSSSGQMTCHCCGMKCHMKSECYKREKAECTFCEQKSHLVQAWLKKTPDNTPGILASSLKPDEASSEATERVLVVDSGSTDHIVKNKKWF